MLLGEKFVHWNFDVSRTVLECVSMCVIDRTVKWTQNCDKIARMSQLRNGAQQFRANATGEQFEIFSICHTMELLVKQMIFILFGHRKSIRQLIA